MCLTICNTISSANLTLFSVAILTASNNTPSSVAKKGDTNVKNYSRVKNQNLILNLLSGS